MKSYLPSIASVFGRGALDCLGEKAAEMKVKKVMVVCGKSAVRAGVLGRAVKSLEAAGIECLTFDEVTPDAPDATVDKGAAIARESGVEALVGIGGGSGMDTAKAIAILLDNPGSINDYFTDPPTFVKTKTPIILVPTTSGTGSECTDHAVIMDTANNRKPAVFMLSTLAVIDPELMVSMPASVTAMSGLDAFTHAAEAITTNNRDERSEVMALAAIRGIAKWLPQAVADGSDLDAREGMALAANWAGMALQDAGVHFGHSIADAFSAAFGTPHGLNCAWGVPELMKLIAPAVPEKVRPIGEALGAELDCGDSAECIGEKTAAAIRALMKKCGIPSISEKGFSREATVAAAAIAFESPLRFACPVEIKQEALADMFAAIYDNY